MAHYAFLNDDNIVIEVIVGKDEEKNGINWERHYGEFRNLKCKRTSYWTLGNQHFNGGTPFRGNYAGIGYKYDETNDAFIPPKTFPSWTLNTHTFLWEPPVSYPTDGKVYQWIEANREWILLSADA
jgi:hypothetical protein